MARGDPLFRQWTLLKVLQAHRFGIGMDELVIQLECNKRTIQRDLAVLQDIFPISHETRDFGKRYWRLPGNMTSTGLQLTTTEMLSLFLSRQLLLPLVGTQFGNGLRTAIDKIGAQLPAKALEHFRNLDDTYFVKNPATSDYSGLDKEIHILNEAIQGQTAVKITYQSFSEGRLVTSEFHPYGMVLLYASLYCIGYLACHRGIRTLKLARVKGVVQLGKSFERPADFCLSDHVHGAFGVFHSEKSHQVRVELAGWAAASVRETQWHHSQKILDDCGDSLTVQFELGTLVELKRWILGFGRCARVLEPADLAEEIRVELQQALRGYPHAAQIDAR